jgi:hypothetical protein
VNVRNGIEYPPEIVTEIINEELQRSEFSDICVKPYDYVIAKIGDEEFIIRDDPFNDFATEILERVSTNRFKSPDEFYHFKSADRVIDALRQKIIYAANLPAHHSNDNEEYRAWIINILGRDEWLLPEENPWHGVYGPLRIDDWRGSIHIFCLTNSITEWMWSNYAGTEQFPATGAVLVLEFHDFNDSSMELLQLYMIFAMLFTTMTEETDSHYLTEFKREFLMQPERKLYSTICFVSLGTIRGLSIRTKTKRDCHSMQSARHRLEGISKIIMKSHIIMRRIRRGGMFLFNSLIARNRETTGTYLHHILKLC